MSSINEPQSAQLAEMLGSVRRKGVQLWVANGELRYRAPKGALSSAEIARLRERQSQIVALLGRSEVLVSDATPVQRKCPQQAPLSFSQLAHWHVFRLGERPSVRSLAAAQRLCGPLQLEVLRMCLRESVRRHAALRTRIVLIDGVPVQEIIESADCELDVLDLIALPESDREVAVKRAIDELILQPIHVTVGPLFGVRLVRVRQDEHVLIVAMEHMISDAFSVAILLRDVLIAYVQRVSNGTVSLPQIPVQFADYATWLRSTHGSWLEKHGGYWSERLRGAGRVRFPQAHGVSPKSCRGWASVPLKIDKSLKAELREWSRLKRTTLVMSIFTAYCALVLRWCNVSQAVLRYQTDGRMNPKVENAIGYFATVLHLRVQLREADTFLDLLQRVIREYCLAYEHADFSYIDSQVPKPEFAHNSCFNWVPQGPKSELPRVKSVQGTITCHPVPFPSPSLKFHERDSEPVVLLYDVDEEVVGGVHFPVHRFSSESMESFGRNFMLFVQRMLREPDKAVPHTLLRYRKGFAVEGQQ